MVRWHIVNRLQYKSHASGCPKKSTITNSCWSSTEITMEQVKDVLDRILAPPVQATLGGVAMIAIGILVGYFVFKAPSEKSLAMKQTAAMEAGESQITNIRFLDRDAQTGDVEFTFETITPVHIRGNVNDEQCAKSTCTNIVSDQNAGTRLRAVNMIGTQTGQNRTMFLIWCRSKSALVSALLHDRNLGVRKEALSVLRNYLPIGHCPCISSSLSKREEYRLEDCSN